MKLLKYKKIPALVIAAVFTVAVMFGTSDTDLPGMVAPVPLAEDLGGVAGDDDGGDAGDDGVSADVKIYTDADIIKKCDLAAENENFELYVNPYEAYFGVKDVISGKVWWSSPINTAADETAKVTQIRRMKSLVTTETVDLNTNSVETQSVYANSVQEDTFEYTEIENGFKYVFTYADLNISFAVYVRLDDDGIRVDVPVGEISDGRDGVQLISLTLLPAFGAADKAEQGCYVVPDGSGAVVNFNNGKVSAASYAAPVYGRDLTAVTDRLSTDTEQIFFPVFGVVKSADKAVDNIADTVAGDTVADGNADTAAGGNADDTADTGLIAAVEKGAENAVISTEVAGQSKTDYNFCRFSFTLRGSGVYRINNATTGQSHVTSVYERGAVKSGDISVKYMPFSGTGLNYSDIAARYRDYLLENNLLTPVSSGNISNKSLYVTFDGGAVVGKSIVGFPVNVQAAATTYVQAMEITDALRALGVSDITVVYDRFNESAITGKISPEAQFSPILGGRVDYEKYRVYSAENKIPVFLSFNMTRYKQSGNGYSFTLNSAVQVTNAIAAQEKFRLAYGEAAGGATVLLSPAYFNGYFGDFAASLAKNDIKYVSVGDAASALYSDSARGGWNRKSTAAVLADNLKRLTQSGVTVSAKTANLYALPYISFISDLPANSSGYDLFDYDVPFAQIVLHGVVPYTCEPVNGSASPNVAVITALSTATPLHYEFMYASPSGFAASDYADRYYAGYTKWLKIASERYRTYIDTVSEFANDRIAHQEMRRDSNIMTNGNIVTTFSRGGVKSGTVAVNVAAGSIEVTE